MSDKIDVPKPIRRDVYRDSGEFGGYGRDRWEYTIIEREYENLLFINGSTKLVGHEWVMGDYLTGLIALRVAEGWMLVTATGEAATLMKLKATYDGAAKLTP